MGRPQDQPIRSASIAQIMMVTALVALNLSIAASLSPEQRVLPTAWVVVGIADFVILQAVIRRGAFRAFHYSFSIFFAGSYLVTWYLILFIRSFKHPIRMHVTDNSFWFIEVGQFWLLCLATFLAALAVGFIAAWLERRWGWDLVSFYRGAIVGFGIWLLLFRLSDPLPYWVIFPSIQSPGRLALGGSTILVGGLTELLRQRALRKRRTHRSELKPPTPGLSSSTQEPGPDFPLS